MAIDAAEADLAVVACAVLLTVDFAVSDDATEHVARQHAARDVLAVVIALLVELGGIDPPEPPRLFVDRERVAVVDVESGVGGGRGARGQEQS